jgi:hypothetical protein
MTTAEKKKRYICSFVKQTKEGMKPNVVVVAASNNVVARAVLCERYGVRNADIPKENFHRNDVEGIKTIRLSETNVYEGESINENFISDDSET